MCISDVRYMLCTSCYRRKDLTKGHTVLCADLTKVLMKPSSFSITHKTVKHYCKGFDHAAILYFKGCSNCGLLKGRRGRTKRRLVFERLAMGKKLAFVRSTTVAGSLWANDYQHPSKGAWWVLEPPTGCTNWSAEVSSLGNEKLVKRAPAWLFEKQIHWNTGRHESISNANSIPYFDASRSSLEPDLAATMSALKRADHPQAEMAVQTSQRDVVPQSLALTMGFSLGKSSVTEGFTDDMALMIRPSARVVDSNSELRRHSMDDTVRSSDRAFPSDGSVSKSLVANRIGSIECVSTGEKSNCSNLTEHSFPNSGVPLDTSLEKNLSQETCQSLPNAVENLGSANPQKRRTIGAELSQMFTERLPGLMANSKGASSEDLIQKCAANEDYNDSAKFQKRSTIGDFGKDVSRMFGEKWNELATGKGDPEDPLATEQISRSRKRQSIFVDAGGKVSSAAGAIKRAFGDVLWGPSTMPDIRPQTWLPVGMDSVITEKREFQISEIEVFGPLERRKPFSPLPWI